MAEADGIVIDWAGPEDSVAIVTLAQPPTNALSPAVRAAMAKALAGILAQHADRLRAVVLAAEGRNFSAATGLEPQPAAPEAPSLADICLIIEQFPVPVVAALDGLVLAGGAELALAAHARVAGARFRFALPNVSLGLSPEAGASQRLPRLVGAAEALSLLLHGRMIGPEEAVAIGLIDELVEANSPAQLLAAAVRHGVAMAAPKPTSGRQEGLADVAAYAAAIAQARTNLRRSPLPAPARIIDCVEAALYLPLENGLALEAVAHEDLQASPEAAGLIAAARGERRLTQFPPEINQLNLPPLATIGVIGAAPGQAALVSLALGRGLRVLWLEQDRDRLASGRAWVAARQEDELRAGRLSPAQRDIDLARLHLLAAPADLAGVGALILGGGDNIDAAELAALAQANPTQPLLVAGGSPGEFGLQVAPSFRISELALPAGYAPARAAVAVQLLRRLGLPPVLVGEMPLVGRRVFAAGRMALSELLASGVPRQRLEMALKEFGQALPDLPEPEPQVETPAPEPLAPSAAKPLVPAEEIRRRWLGAMANEAFRLLDCGIARRPSDIDQLLLAGYGFPRWRGGPMHQAALRGLMVLRSDLRHWQQAQPSDAGAGPNPLWQPQALLDRMIADGQRLDTLDIG